jgi:hypothetical protein
MTAVYLILLQWFNCINYFFSEVLMKTILIILLKIYLAIKIVILTILILDIKNIDDLL